ncbi:hypothetical protein LCGC14_2850460 [marine sediment metagenome]|uniref:Uncharacterized protein n=1 Tax=marine sediment metagenome TaxID=412755 RepID=A0A0F8Y8J5_9ZZZZ
MNNQSKKKPTTILTFFEKGFYNEIEALELTKTEKTIFSKDMISLTPEERKNLIAKMKGK